MAKTAKIFMTGRSQAVRLPKEFRFKGDIVNISRDPVTGDVMLSEKSKPAVRWEAFLKLRDVLGFPEDFLSDRGDEMDRFRDPFA